MRRTSTIRGMTLSSSVRRRMRGPRRVDYRTLALVIAFLFAALVIGLLLTVPLVVLGLVWLAMMAWRGGIRVRRYRS